MIETDKYPVACHAPGIDAAKAAEYMESIAAIPDRELKDRLTSLMACVNAYIDLPISTNEDTTTFVYGTGDNKRSCRVVPFDRGKIDTLWDVTPYTSDLAPYESYFNSLPSGTQENPDGSVSLIDPDAKACRDMAFHILWYVKEIALDREPLTMDKVS